MKREKPSLVIGITGCVAQQEREKIFAELPFVDFVMGPDNIDELPWILEELNNSKVLRTEFDRSSDRIWKTETKILNPGPTAFVSVMKGCDHFCSYCIVPFTRGREKSRPIEDIVLDVEQLVARGVKEVTFLGQNINSYGKRSGETLTELFYRVHEITGLQRIRFTTSHPGDLSQSLIECFRNLPKLCSSFHLPVQSGSDRVLRSMRRFYNRSQYLEKIDQLRNARADVAFSTDIIVGFPGETEEDFEKTLTLAQQVRYDNAYSFIFSPRPGTAAAELKDSTPESVKISRLMTLQKELQRISRELHLAETGKIKSILIEGHSKRDALKLTGRTSQNIPVHIDAFPEIRIGDIVEVEIVEATLTHLKGLKARAEEQQSLEPARVEQMPT